MPAAVRHPRTPRHSLARLQAWSVVPRVAVPIRRAATEFVALLVRDAAAEPVVRRSNAAGTAWSAAQVAHRSVEPIAAVPNRSCCDGECCDGTCFGEELCCPTGNVVCNGSCCDAGETCCGDGSCCSGTCVEGGQTCCQADTGQVCGDGCCAAGLSCCSIDGCCEGECFGDDQYCCLPESSAYCGDRCCDPTSSSAVRTTESQFASLRRPAAATRIVLAQDLALGSATGSRVPATIQINRCRAGMPLAPAISQRPLRTPVMEQETALKSVRYAHHLPVLGVRVRPHAAKTGIVLRASATTIRVAVRLATSVSSPIRAAVRLPKTRVSRAALLAAVIVSSTADGRPFCCGDNGTYALPES